MTFATARKLSCATLALLASVAVPNLPLAQGFEIALNGEDVVRDAGVDQTVRDIDLRLAEADVQISYDALDPEPRLNIEIAAPLSGGQVQVVGETNYPAFINRGEVRLIDLAGATGPRLVSVTPLDPNQRGQIAVPEGDFAVVYRVYGARGRFDETRPLPLSGPDARGLSPDIEDGVDFTDVRNIRVNGGAVTVTAQNITQGGTLIAFGEVISADASGGAVIQRILPSGAHAIEVEVRDNRGPLSFGRDLEIDTADWLYFVVADVEARRTRDRESGSTNTATRARLQVFVDGETQSGLQITGSLDSGGGPISEIFTRLTEKDPASVAGRIDTNPAQITFGDDSTTTDLTPTSGRIYLRVEREENFFLWGDYRAGITGSGFLRNERALYGAQLHLETPQTTNDGQARASIDIAAAQNDQLYGREVFRGTDGTVFFLSRQDLTSGTVTVTVELRDPTTGRVVDRTALEQGQDYLINEFQGVLRLNDPVPDSVSGGLIQSGDLHQFVVVQYEYTPVGFEAGGINLSGRIEAWATDDLRLGITGLSQDTGTTTQEAYGVDLRYEYGDNSFVQIDYARTDGPGFDFVTSSDAGLLSDTVTATAGSGQAVKLEFELSFADIDPNRTEVIGGYAEAREQGFSTLDYQVTAARGDQRLLGFYAAGTAIDGVTYRVNADHLDNEFGDDRTDIGAEFDMALSAQTRLAFGAEYQSEGSSNRTDVAARLTYSLDEDRALYAFAQGAVALNNMDRNDRFGLGSDFNLENGWSLLGEVSDGSTGFGLRMAAQREDEDGNSSYFGWEIDPERAIQTSLTSGDNGRLVFGGRRQVSDVTSVFGEHTYDLLGARRELTAAYGIDYQPSDYLTFGATIAAGQVQDDVSGDIERLAYSVSAAYDNDEITGQARFEYRQDQDLSGTGQRNVDTIVVAGDLRWQIDEERRLLAGLLASRTVTDTASLLGGDYVDASLGFAYRPIEDERMNILASYRYLRDEFGQSLDGVAGAGQVQRSHVLNVEGNYDLNPNWTLGAKLGFRLTESAADAASTYTGNDAGLAVINARYHLPHQWDALLEVRHFEAIDTQFTETGGLFGIYRHFGANVMAGVGYNFTSFSDDLTDLSQDDEGTFINIVAQF